VATPAPASENVPSVITVEEITCVYGDERSPRTRFFPAPAAQTLTEQDLWTPVRLRISASECENARGTFPDEDYFVEETAQETGV
jgi:hypothetical protein